MKQQLLYILFIVIGVFFSFNVNSQVTTEEGAVQVDTFKFESVQVEPVQQDRLLPQQDRLTCNQVSFKKITSISEVCNFREIRLKHR